MFIDQIGDRMKIFFVRHGESVAQPDHLVCGDLDIQLTEKGLLQSEDLAKELKLHDIHFDHIYVSPLKRALRTLSPYLSIIGKRQSETSIVDELKEICVGDYAKMNFQGLKKEDHRLYYHGDNPDVSWPNGESMTDYYKKVTGWFETNVLTEENIGKNILIVSHVGSCLLYTSPSPRD